ncbi:MAG: hypothetical protein ACTHKP_10030 [Nitrososphaeraceae archaeon]
MENKKYLPLYNEAGVKKFAFLYPPGSPIPSTNGLNIPDEKFPCLLFFRKRSKAMAF